MAKSKKKGSVWPKVIVSILLSAVLLAIGFHYTDHITGQVVYGKLLKPLLRLIFFIAVGLFAGQLIEYTGWTRYLAMLGAPFFRYANLGMRCSSAFTAAFISGATANAMLLDFYEEGKITKKQMYLSNFMNNFPAYFLHLPSTFFIVIPLTGTAGVLYFLLTFSATLLRTACFIFYGHFRIKPESTDELASEEEIAEKKKSGFLNIIKKRFPKRVLNIAVYVVPIYIGVFVLNSFGMFEMADRLLSKYVVTSFIPIHSLSVVILSFAAEFTSGFAAAGAMLDAGVITTKQTVIALIIGNILAFPLRALRHQLPRYMGIFSPKMGLEILLMNQGFRIISLVFVTYIYYIIF